MAAHGHTQHAVVKRECVDNSKAQWFALEIDYMSKSYYITI